jgi:hypothetical protein
MATNNIVYITRKKISGGSPVVRHGKSTAAVTPITACRELVKFEIHRAYGKLAHSQRLRRSVEQAMLTARRQSASGFPHRPTGGAA